MMKDLYEIRRNLLIGTVLKMVQNGKTYEEIAKELEISLDTVRTITKLFKIAD